MYHNLKLYGTMSFEEIVSPTLEILDAGNAEWHPNLAATLRKLVSEGKNTSGTREQKFKQQVINSMDETE